MKVVSIFNDDQVKQLERPLAAEEVKHRKGTSGQLSYLAGHQVIESANRIFGFGNWSTEITHLHQASRTEYEKPANNPGGDPRPMISIAYTCHLKLSVRPGVDGAWVTHEDIGFGDGVAGHSAHGISSCIELATKEAVTDALKRCFRYYGNQFGLSLYDKDDAPLPESEIDLSLVVTEHQLTEMRELYQARDIDDEWVMVALKAEAYPWETLEEMRQDWYRLAMQTIRDYKRDELERAAYDEDMAKVQGLMEKSANMSMLKALFAEAYRKTGKYQDKEKQAELTELYEKMKSEFEPKPEKKQ